MTIFADRREAGRCLGALLEQYAGSDAIVLGIPRGGVVVAAEVADHLRLPLAAVVVRKLGAPGGAEFAVGAIADGVRIVSREALRMVGADDEDLARVEARERTELRRREGIFGSDPEIAGRAAIIVDDGIATGSTATAAARSIRARHPSLIVVATPVAPREWRPPRDAVDEYISAAQPTRFRAVGEFYRDFTQTSDEEVRSVLARNLPADG